ncbi:MAG: cytochrome c [Balneolaceae bacterium]|nr:cytochrome c [Balneolaceae bacterium]
MKILKWVGITLLTLVVILLIFIAVTYLITERHFNKTYQIDAETVEVTTDSSVVAHGKHVATIRGCVECHGEGLGGQVFIDDPAIGLLIATNLTTGEGGIGREYTNKDMVRAIRHGVDKNGKPSIFMPSHEYNPIDRDDLSALVSYIRSVEPVDNVQPETEVGMLARFLYMYGGMHLVPARLIDHSKPIPEPVEERTPRELGEYLAVTCTGCHGEGFAGGPIPGTPPEWPAAPNITPAGNIGNWTAEEFIRTMETGVTPEGKELTEPYMPWRMLGAMTDEELKGLYTYLRSLPEKETGTR